MFFSLSYADRYRQEQSAVAAARHSNLEQQRIDEPGFTEGRGLNVARRDTRLIPCRLGLSHPETTLRTGADRSRSDGDS